MLRPVAVCLLMRVVMARHLLDLTHVFDGNAPKWPLGDLLRNRSYYSLDPLIEDWLPGGGWLSLKRIELYEHMGTHMDAPFHYGSGRQTMDAIPVHKLMGPGVKIDVKGKAKKNPNYAVTVGDIKEYEVKHGKIPRSAIVMMNSGWSQKYDNANLVFGTDTLSDDKTFNFPGWSIEACEFLLTQRQIAVLGVDTPSTDPGDSNPLLCHMYLQPNNVPLLEYVANLDTMPPSGSTIVLGAMNHRGGSGGPTRVLCIVDDDTISDTSGASTEHSFSSFIVVTSVAFFSCRG